MDSEKPEIAQQIRRSLSKLTKDVKIRDLESLPGSSALLPYSLLRLMGDLPPAHKQRMAELAAQRQELEGQGKSARDIDELLRNLYDAQTNGKNMHEIFLRVCSSLVLLPRQML